MGLTINTNIAAMDASRNLNQTEMSLGAAMRHLSSGLRINSAADDVAGYAISQRLQAQVNGLNQAALNSQDAVSLAQTGQGALNDVATVRGTLTRITHDDEVRRWNADILLAAGMISGWHSERARRLGESAVEHWRQFKKVDPFWS